jgi:3-oxoacyl-[acyl-carrier protein] reductase
VGPLRRCVVEHGGLAIPGMSHYIASKMGIIGFMRGLANDVANDDTPQMRSCPASRIQRLSRLSRKTKNAPHRTAAIKRLGNPGMLLVILFLTSDDAAFITGQAIVIDGGQYRIG